METFSASLAICAGNSPGPGEFLAQMPVTQNFDDFFDLRPNFAWKPHSLERKNTSNWPKIPFAAQNLKKLFT